jgi:hypothetical protein
MNCRIIMLRLHRALCLGSFFSFSLLLIVIIVLHHNLSKYAFGYSPSFVNQVVMNNYTSVIDAHDNPTKDDKITILSANYESDGRYLNATIWLAAPLYKKYLPTTATYGILIDADNNNATGMQGADYGIKIQWNNQSKTWERIIELYETPNPKVGLSEKRTLEVEPDTKFYEDNKRYVSIDLDLGTVDFPAQYRAIFFAEDHIKPLKLDFTNWVNIPPPQLNMSVLQNPISLSAGDQKTLELQLKSNPGIEPQVHLSSSSKRNGITLSFEPNILTMPSFGMATIQIKVQVPNNITAGQQITLPILATLNVPPKSFIDPSVSSTNRVSNIDQFHIPPTVRNQEGFAQSSLTIRILTFEESLGNFFTGLFTPITSIITTLITIISGVLGYLVASRRPRRGTSIPYDST